MTITEIKSFNIQIWVGLKDNFLEWDFSSLENFIQNHVNDLGECITITPTRYIYTNGNENGVVIGYINYPRFPKDEAELIKRSLDLAEKLMFKFNQCRVTVTTPNKTYMLLNTELIQEIK